jgi:poly-beta-1,6-N-acetyl-D-glucosamine synthase
LVFKTLFFLSAILLGYIYAGYPLLLLAINRFRATSSQQFGAKSDTKPPSISVIVAAFNEEAVIEEKVHNLMSLDYPPESYRVIISSDASSDATENIVAKLVQQYGDSRLHLIANPNRTGKTGAINSAMSHVTSDITVFTDANAMLEADSLEQVKTVLADMTIGGVAGHLRSTNANANEATQSSSLYWRYEEFIKHQESASGSTMGADGGVFAIRSDLFRPLAEHVLDDFCTSMGVIFQGFRLVYSPRVVGREKVAEVASEEYSRKIRIANRSYNSYRYVRASIAGLSLIDRWKFFSHKLLRWYSFPLLVICFLANVGWVIQQGTTGWAVLFLMLQIVLYVLAALSWRGFSLSPPVLSSLAGAACYFTMANLATFVGILRSYKGTKTAFWSSTQSGR